MAEVLRQSTESLINLTGNVGLFMDSDEVHSSWVLWSVASINKHFIDRRGSYDLYLEGDERTYQDEAEFAELRIDGPFILRPSNGLYFLDVEINVLIQSHIDPKDLYKIHKATGNFAKAFKNNICVYKYGEGMFDDGSLLGTYKLKTDLRDRIDINHYGIIKEDVRMTQTTIEGHYRLELWNPQENP